MNEADHSYSMQDKVRAKRIFFVRDPIVDGNCVPKSLSL